MLGVQRMEEPFTLVCDGVFFDAYSDESFGRLIMY
jgi:hypothetical protein